MLTEIEMSDRKTNQNATLPIHHTSSHTNTQHVNLILKHAENEVEKEAQLSNFKELDFRFQLNITSNIIQSFQLVEDAVAKVQQWLSQGSTIFFRPGAKFGFGKAFHKLGRARMKMTYELI